ncbi:MAG: MOSC N-terminal beta barrel domain-containing protein [Pseudomonadota bacterium]
MAGQLAEIWRHPVKGVSAERIDQVALAAGAPFPHDRRWAIAHGASAFDPAAPEWVARRNFVVQAHVPELARTEAQYDEEGGFLTLSHPEHGSVTLAPGTEAGDAALTAWIAPVAGERQPGPYRTASLPDGQHLSDMPQNYVSILSLASLRALGDHVGQAMQVRRFRGNLWLEGLGPWQEEEWIGREIAIGEVRFRVDEPIGRCRATEASPVSGRYDAATVATLRKARGHTEFGVYATVIEGGALAIGDDVSA